YALRPLLDQTLIHLEGAERIILTPGWYGHFFPWGVLAEHAGWRTTTGELLPLIILPTLSVLPRLRKRSYNLTGPVLVLGNPIGDLPYADGKCRTKWIWHTLGDAYLLFGLRDRSTEDQKNCRRIA
ncbi:MAG TPA: hypothetical protein VIY29_17975, partial [Ktedonobacteraceae bacterium]